MSDYLIHYGIKGMKWGVRKDRFKTVFKNRSKSNRKNDDYAKRLLFDDLKTSEKEDKILDAASREIDRLKKPKVMYSDRNYTLTKEGQAYEQKKHEIYSRMNKKLEPIHELERKERRDLFNKTFVTSESKELVRSAHDTRRKLESLYDSVLGESSPSAKKAYAEYKRTHKGLDDVDYGFSHYEWRKGNKYYDLAYKEYKQQSNSLKKQYDNQLRDIGKSITSDYFKSDSDDTMFWVDQFVTFSYPGLINDEKKK